MIGKEVGDKTFKYCLPTLHANEEQRYISFTCIITTIRIKTRGCLYIQLEFLRLPYPSEGSVWKCFNELLD